MNFKLNLWKRGYRGRAISLHEDYVGDSATHHNPDASAFTVFDQCERWQKYCKSDYPTLNQRNQQPSSRKRRCGKSRFSSSFHWQMMMDDRSFVSTANIMHLLRKLKRKKKYIKNTFGLSKMTCLAHTKSNLLKRQPFARRTHSPLLSSPSASPITIAPSKRKHYDGINNLCNTWDVWPYSSALVGATEWCG